MSGPELPGKAKVGAALLCGCGCTGFQFAYAPEKRAWFARCLSCDAIGPVEKEMARVAAAADRVLASGDLPTKEDIDKAGGAITLVGAKETH